MLTLTQQRVDKWIFEWLGSQAFMCAAACAIGCLFCSVRVHCVGGGGVSFREVGEEGQCYVLAFMMSSVLEGPCSLHRVVILAGQQEGWTRSVREEARSL